MRVAISGASGLIGKALSASLAQSGHHPHFIRRISNTASANEIAWDASRGLIEKEKLEGADVVIHLAGENIAARRWSASQKERIRSSRVEGTALIAKTLSELERNPRLLLSASAIGIYGDRGDETITEDSPCGLGFLSEVGQAWEHACAAARRAGIRVVHIRLGMVLDRRGGALAKMLPIFKLGLGGRLGNGRQWMSWIALQDVISAIEFLISKSDAAGSFNLTAPNPVTNSEFTRTLADTLRRPAFLPVPSAVLKMVFGEMADALLLSSTRVLPKRLQGLGFKFAHPTLEQALRCILSDSR